MAKLIDKLPLPDRRSEMVDDCCRLLDAEVSRKSGLSGLAVKAGYKMLKGFKPGAVRHAVDGLLDEFIEALEPFHADFEKSGTGTFGGHIKGRKHEAAEALLAVTDRRAQNPDQKALAKAYAKLRGTGLRNVEEAVPGLADLMDRYYQG